MKKLMLMLLVLPILFMSIPAVAQYAVGEHVDDFTLPDHNNRTVNLYDYQDLIVVIAFWSDG